MARGGESATKRGGTNSSAAAKRSRDASCLSVDSFNGTKRRAQYPLQSYRCMRTNKFCSVLFVVVVHAAGCDKYSFTDASPSVR